jgi:hypothetical protein
MRAAVLAITERFKMACLTRLVLGQGSGRQGQQLHHQKQHASAVGHQHGPLLLNRSHAWTEAESSEATAGERKAE